MKTCYKAREIIISQQKGVKSDQLLFVGIDVCKATLDVHFRSSGKELSFSNEAKGITNLCAALKKAEAHLVVIEATGGMERQAVREMHSAGIPVAVINPKQARDFAKATGKLAKTDKLDASVLAHFGEAIRPPVRAPRDKEAERLNGLIVRRSQIIEMISIEKIRLASAYNFTGRGINTVIICLKKELKKIDKGIDKLIGEDEEMTKKRKIIESVPGVARGTAVNLISELPELGSVSKKEIGALVGVVPFNKDSGKTKGRRMIWGGRARVRKALYMAVISGIRCNSAIKAFYLRLRAAGKVAKVALTACIHKLVIILNSMLKQETSWQDGRILGKALEQVVCVSKT